MPAPNPEAQALLFPKLVESTPPNPTANLYKRSPMKTKTQLWTSYGSSSGSGSGAIANGHRCATINNDM